MLALMSACKKEPARVFVQEGTVVINGSDVYFKRYAIGHDSAQVWQRQAIMVVHGGPVMDHSYFIPHLDGLAAEYQLLFYDQRASGRSAVDIDTATMNLDGFTEDIELLRQAMGFDQIDLLGHSWGGLLAMKYAIRYSGNLDHLILSNAMAPSATDWKAETQEIGKRATEQDAKEREALMSSGALSSDDPRDAIRKLLLQSFAPQMYKRSNIDSLQLYVPIDFMIRSQVYALLRPDMEAFDLYPDMEKITAPTLLLYGETEPGPAMYADKVTGRVQSSELVIIKEAGHFPFIENQVDYNKAVLNFLK